MFGKRRPPLLHDSALSIAPWIALLTLIALWPRPAKSVSAGTAPARSPARAHLPGMSEGHVGSPGGLEALEPGRGRDAGNPAQVPAKGWKDIVWRTWREVSADRLPAVAGGVTFYALLAIFPAIGAFVSLYGLFADVGEAERQLHQLAAVFPAEVIKLIGDQMLRLAGDHDGKLSIAFAIGLALSLWSAHSGMSALFDGLNIAYDETEKRNYLRRNLVTFGFTVGLLVFVAAATWLLIGLPLAARAAGLGSLDIVWVPLRWLAVFAMSVAGFALLFRHGPSREPARWRWLRWGAAFSAVVWLGGSLAFSLYINTGAHYDATYGPLGAVIAFMVWLWFSVMSILIGAELNAEVEHQTAVDSTTGAPVPMGQRHAAMADTIGKPLPFTAKSLWAQVQDRFRRKPKPRPA
ncbi:MAG: ribonuclease [Caulobacter sp.]|nr:ribonuclease [Caulobacter sp.]